MEISTRPAPNAVLPAANGMTSAFRSDAPMRGPSGTVTTAAGKVGQLTDRQITLLEARGIDTELAVSLGWREAGRKGTGDWLEIPYLRGGVEVNYKQRTLSGEKFFSQKTGGEQILYNVDVLSTIGDAPLIITEGELDWIIAQQCGYVNSVSVPNGAPAKEVGDRENTKYEYHWDIPKTVKKIILATDGDGPGINLMNDLALRLGKHRCWWVKYPEGTKDLNDVFLAHGAKGVEKVISDAQSFKIDGLYSLDELPPIIEYPALDVGISGLERYFKIRRGDFSVVTGIPSHGKSTWVNHIAFNMAKKHGWHVCFASFEQPPQTEHAKALRTLYHQRPDYLLSDEERKQAHAWFKNRFSFIVPNDDADEPCDLLWLKERMAASVTQHNARMIVIDPWNEIDHDTDESKKSLTQYISGAIRSLKRFARCYGVHIMVVAHPAKMLPDKEGKFPIPKLYQISDSAHWYNKADQGVVIHRGEETNQTIVRIAKSRYHYALGVPGDVTLWFNDHDHKFYSNQLGREI